MAPDFPGGSLSFVWIVLYDDDNLSDDRSIKLRALSFYDQTGAVLHSVHSGFTKAVWRDRNLFCSAGCGCTYNSGMFVFDKIYEEDCFKKYTDYELAG